jgi:hypothetical protein
MTSVNKNFLFIVLVTTVIVMKPLVIIACLALVITTISTLLINTN